MQIIKMYMEHNRLKMKGFVLNDENNAKQQLLSVIFYFGDSCPVKVLIITMPTIL